MKVAIIRNASSHSDFGGAELVSLWLSKGVDNALLITGTRSLMGRAELEEVDYQKGPRSPIQNIFGWRVLLSPIYLLYGMFSVIKYVRIFKKNGIEIIHCMSAEDFAYATIAGKLLNLPVVWTDHAELKGVMQNNDRRFKVLLGKIIQHRIELTDKIISISKNDQNLLKERVPEHKDKIVLIANGVEDRYKEDKNTKYNFVFDSRINKEKGVYELVDALGNISSSNRSLHIASPSGDITNLKKYIQKSKVKGITVGTYSSQKDYDQAIQEAEVYVLPSHMEGHSLGLLRAMMFKKPIITTAVGGTVDFLDQSNCVFVEVGDVRSLSKAMDQLLHDKLLCRKLATKARQDFENYFSLKIMVENYSSLYRELI